jgi:hypothetical protein
MAHRGGPWRLTESEFSNRRVAGNAGARRPLPTGGGDRSLRWIVEVYTFALVGGGLVGLFGLWEGWW